MTMFDVFVEPAPFEILFTILLSVESAREARKKLPFWNGLDIFFVYTECCLEEDDHSVQLIFFHFILLFLSLLV